MEHIGNKWVCVLHWRNMKSDLFDLFADLSTQYKNKTGHTLCMRGGPSDWSELGYWEEEESLNKN